jgi:hypothetical protein
MTRLRVIMAIGFGWCITGVWSCGPREGAPQPARTATAPAAVHAVHSSRLHSLMSKLGSTSAKSWPQEIESDRAADAEQARAERFEEARRLAAAISGAAGQIPEAITGVQLEPADRESFLAQVERLRSQAAELEGCAARHDFDAMRTALQSVRATCNGCHSQFRNVAGPIKLPRTAI